MHEPLFYHTASFLHIALYVMDFYMRVRFVCHPLFVRFVCHFLFLTEVSTRFRFRRLDFRR